MAGLLDIFGSSGTDSLGLLGMSQEDIKRARDDAQAQAMYALAGRLFQGGNTGQSIAQGLQMGQQAYKQAMNEQLGDKLQTVKLQDMLRQQQEAQEIKRRQAAVENIIGQAYRPAQTTYEQLTPQQMEQAAAGQRAVGQTTTPARFDIQGAAPMLMALPEGRKALADIASAQKAMAPEYKQAGDFLYKITPEGAEQVAGQAKGTADMQGYQLAQNQGYRGTFMQYQQDLKQAGAPKVSVDLKDPTAVAKAQKDLVGDWRGVVKDTGAMEVADRYKAAQQAVAQGNAGNKAADGALIYAVAKIYDSSGAVQEGDKKTIMGNRSIPENVKAAAQRIFSGQDLLPSERQGLLNMVTTIVQEKSKNLNAQMAPYATLSKQLGGSGDLLLNPLSDVLTQQQPDLASLAAAELARRRRK